jgi:hypothetical protein
MTPERAAEIANQIAEKANECCYRSDGYEKDIAALAKTLIIQACAEQREEDEKIFDFLLRWYGVLPNGSK